MMIIKDLSKAGKYQIIYADPPWQYRDKRANHKRICGGAQSHYSTMAAAQLKELPIDQISAKNCMLFLWVTFPILQGGLDLIASWGFEYKTLGFSWIKINKKNGQIFFGIGYYTKSNCEICLIGVKGKPIKQSDKVSSVLLFPRGEHSEKPRIIRDKIVDLCGDLPRIELFAREETLGWDAWGNEVERLPQQLGLDYHENQAKHKNI